MPEQGVASFGGFFLFYPEMGTWRTEQLNQGCCVWCLPRCPPDVLGHTCCVLLLILLTNRLACMTRTQFISKVAPLFAVTWRRFNGHDFSLGWVLENFKPSALQEKTGQAATEEMQTGGLSQMVWLSNWHEGSPEAGFSLQRGFFWPYSISKKMSCHHFVTILPFHLLIPSPHWMFIFSSCPCMYL